MKRIRITSNGEPLSERIYDADTGEEIKTVLRARIELDLRNAFPTVWLEFGDVELDIVAAQVDEEGKIAE